VIRLLRYLWHAAVFFPVFIILIVAWALQVPLREVALFALCAFSTVSLELCLVCLIQRIETLSEEAKDARKPGAVSSAAISDRVESRIEGLKTEVATFGMISLFSLLAFSILVICEVTRMKGGHDGPTPMLVGVGFACCAFMVGVALVKLWFTTRLNERDKAVSRIIQTTQPQLPAANLPQHAEVTAAVTTDIVPTGPRI
jgi:hypothetical protein